MDWFLYNGLRLERVNQMTLLWAFFGKLPLLQNTHKETFFLKSVFAGVRKSRLQGCRPEKKEGVYMTTGNLAFCLFLYLNGEHF